MTWRDRIKDQPAIGKALVTANLIAERLGQFLSQSDVEAIREGLAAYDRLHGHERN